MMSGNIESEPTKGQNGLKEITELIGDDVALRSEGLDRFFRAIGIEKAVFERMHNFKPFSVTASEWIGEYVDENSSSLESAELEALSNLDQEIRSGSANEDFSRASRSVVAGIGVAYLSYFLVNSVGATLVATGLVRGDSSLSWLGGAILGYENVPGLGGFSSWFRIATQMAIYSIPSARKYYLEQLDTLSEQGSPPNKKDDLALKFKTLLYAGFPVFTFFDGGWVFTALPEGLRRKELLNVILWKMSKEFKFKSNSVREAVETFREKFNRGEKII